MKRSKTPREWPVTGGLSACHSVHRPPGPREGQTARPASPRRAAPANLPELCRTGGVVTSNAADISTIAVALGSAAAAFAVPASLGVAQPLPAVQSEPATPGRGHGDLLGREPGRLAEVDPEGNHAGEDPAGVVELLGGVMPYSSAKNSWRYRQRCSDGSGREADRTTRLAHQVGWPAWPVPRDPSRAVMILRLGVAARRAGPWRCRRGPGRPGPVRCRRG